MPARSWGRFWLYVTPVSAVAVVLLGVVSGGERPFRSARIYSGPTQDVTALSLRVEVSQRDRLLDAPLGGVPFSVSVAEGGGQVARTSGKTDELGSAEVLLQLPRPRDSALELSVEPLGGVEAPLAHGLVLGSTAAFLAAAGRRGGFVRGRHGGELELAVAPAHGVLMTAQGPLRDELLIRAEHAGAPVAGASVSVALDGAEPAKAQVQTDAEGLARLQLQPRAPELHVELEASAPGVGQGTLGVRLDVVQGAIRVTRRGDRLLLESSGAASRAYLGFFDQHRRYLGLSVPLSLGAGGRLSAELPWPQGLDVSPLWVVASSQPDLASPSAVGWPVVGADEPAPHTFDARELLLLDGAPVARLREERRARRVRFVTAGYATLALLVTLLLFARRLRDAEQAMAAHLAESGLDDAAQSIAPKRQGRALIAASCIALGFIVLALFALLKN